MGAGTAVSRVGACRACGWPALEPQPPRRASEHSECRARNDPRVPPGMTQNQNQKGEKQQQKSSLLPPGFLHALCVGFTHDLLGLGPSGRREALPRASGTGGPGKHGAPARVPSWHLPTCLRPGLAGAVPRSQPRALGCHAYARCCPHMPLETPGQSRGQPVPLPAGTELSGHRGRHVCTGPCGHQTWQ